MIKLLTFEQNCNHKFLKIIHEKIIILTNDGSKSLYFSSRNLKNVKSKNVSSFSTCDVADSSFLLMDKISVEYLNEKLS